MRAARIVVVLGVIALLLLSRPQGVIHSAAAIPAGKIAFASLRDGASQVYLMNTDGSQVEALTNGDNEHSSRAPAWSPDGKRLLYLTSIPSNGSNKNIVVANADGSNPVTLIEDVEPLGFDDYADWSFDGKWLIFAIETHDEQRSYSEFHLVSLDGTTKITINPIGRPDYSGVRFLPDGSLLAFERDATGAYQVIRLDKQGKNPKAAGFTIPDYLPSLSPTHDQFALTSGNVYMLWSSTTNKLQKVATLPGLSIILMFKWSPDGAYLWMQGFLAPPLDNGTPQLQNYTPALVTYIVSADGKHIQQFLINTDLDGNRLSWSPDSQFIAYDAKEGDHYQIFISRPDGSDKVQLTQDGDNTQPAWQP